MIHMDYKTHMGLEILTRYLLPESIIWCKECIGLLHTVINYEIYFEVTGMGLSKRRNFGSV